MKNNNSTVVITHELITWVTDRKVPITCFSSVHFFLQAGHVLSNWNKLSSNTMYFLALYTGVLEKRFYNIYVTVPD